MKTIKKLPLLLSLLSFLTIFTPVNAEIKVVATIKPIHSLASYLMDGVGKPDLIVDGYASPHGFALKPSPCTSHLSFILKPASFNLTNIF